MTKLSINYFNEGYDDKLNLTFANEDLRIPNNKIFAMTGENGQGKSTFLRNVYSIISKESKSLAEDNTIAKSIFASFNGMDKLPESTGNNQVISCIDVVSEVTLKQTLKIIKEDLSKAKLFWKQLYHLEYIYSDLLIMRSIVILCIATQKNLKS